MVWRKSGLRELMLRLLTTISAKAKVGNRVLVWGPQAVPLHQGRISLTISRRWSISCFVVIYDRRLRASSRSERRATNREFRVTVLSSPLQGL